MTTGVLDERSMELIESICRSLYDNSLDHGWPHIERVLGYAFNIVEGEELDISRDKIKLAIYLHDLGRVIGEPHAFYSALIARELLGELGLPGTLIEEIVGAIEEHSYSYKRSTEPSTLLSVVLSDADKLDALGVVGFLRVFIYGCRNSRSLEDSLRHFHEKIFKLKNHVKLEYSRRLAEQLDERTRLLLGMLQDELGYLGIQIASPSS